MSIFHWQLETGHWQLFRKILISTELRKIATGFLVRGKDPAVSGRSEDFQGRSRGGNKSKALSETSWISASLLKLNIRYNSSFNTNPRNQLIPPD
jgi:hypothetical protein